MRKRLLDEVSRDELERMREGGMTNRDIAESIGVSVSTIYKHIGPQPSGLRGQYSSRYEMPPDKTAKEDPAESEEAALIVENRTIGLAGLFAGYRVNIREKEVTVFVEDGIDALVIPFKDVEAFAKELCAINKHINGLKVGNEVW